MLVGFWKERLWDPERPAVTGLWWIAAGAALAATGVLPILLYVLLGPEDGNPIGLGLLGFAAVGAAQLLWMGSLGWFAAAFLRWLRGTFG